MPIEEAEPTVATPVVESAPTGTPATTPAALRPATLLATSPSAKHEQRVRDMVFAFPWQSCNDSGNGDDWGFGSTYFDVYNNPLPCCISRWFVAKSVQTPGVQKKKEAVSLDAMSCPHYFLFEYA